jgi:tetratricopeptide (TPR) repeat protein
MKLNRTSGDDSPNLAAYRNREHEFLTNDLDLLDSDAILSLGKELRSENNWRLLIELSEFLLGHGPLLPEMEALYLMALRGTDNQLAAFEYLAGRDQQMQNLDVRIQWASLLCELGDFKPLLDLSRPADDEEKRDQATDFLILLAWAHENYLEGQHVRRAANFYQRILALLKDRRPDPDDSYISPHPEMKLGQQSTGPKIDELRILWALRGYGNCLAVLPNQIQEAKEQWAAVVASRFDSFSQHDPHTQRIVGWCHFRLENYDESLEAYRMAVDSGVSKYRPQLERSLVLFVAGRVSAAVDQLEKALCDLKDLNAVRRCGLSRVALFEFVRALLSNPELAAQRHTQEVITNLHSELDRAVSILHKSLPDHAKRISADTVALIEQLETILPAMSDKRESSVSIINWQAIEIVGFEDPGNAMCGLFSPVVEYQKKRFASVAEISALDGSATLPKLKDEPIKIRSLSKLKLPSPTTRILYLSDASRRIIDKWSIASSLSTHLTWHNAGEEDGILACVESKEGTTFLDQFARELIQKALSILEGSVPEPEAGLAENSALLGFYAAQRPESVYQAALLYYCLSDQPVDLSIARSDEVTRLIPDPARLSHFSKLFRTFVKATPRTALVDFKPQTVFGLAKQVIQRAREISSVRDPVRRATEAIWAAAEMQLLLAGAPEMTQLQKHIADTLPRATMWYLSPNVETVVLAQEPAFYCSMELSGLSKPALDVFSYFKAPYLVQANRFSEGPVAALAKATLR